VFVVIESAEVDATQSKNHDVSPRMNCRLDLSIGYEVLNWGDVSVAKIYFVNKLAKHVIRPRHLGGKAESAEHGYG